MIAKQTKTIEMSDEERAIIRDCAGVLDDLNYLLEDGEELNIDDSCYDKGFIEEVFSFICDLRVYNSLTATRG